MNVAEEHAEVQRIERKKATYGPGALSNREQAILAYSPYGTGGACPSHSAVRATPKESPRQQIAREIQEWLGL